VTASSTGAESDTAASAARQGAAALAAAVLAEEARRQEERRGTGDDSGRGVESPLPGVGGTEMPLGTVLRVGGTATIAVLFGLSLVDNLDQAAFVVLAPDIQRSLHVSTGVMGMVGAVAGLTMFLAAIPLGVLGDRSRRTTIAAVSTALWAVAAVMTGAVHALWQMVATRTVSGVGRANEQPIQSSILADAYPPEGRGRIFGLHRAAAPLGLLIGPAIAGGIASLAGGRDGWRWAFVGFAIPATLLAVAALTLREPARGRFEQEAILGGELERSGAELPVPIGAAFARLKKVKTFAYLMAALAALGFAITTVPIYMNFILKDHFGLSAGGRGVVGSICAAGALAGALVGGRSADRIFRVRPERTLLLVGGAVAALGVGFACQAYAPNIASYVAIGVVTQALLFAGLVPASPVVAAVTPPRLRSTGFALISLYLSLVGGLLGAVLMAGLSSSLGDRLAVAIVAPISCVVACGVLVYGSRFVRADIAATAADLLEERDERARIAAGGAIPVLQVRSVDFSYGQVQVLFDVNLDVREGEVLALLGTNGAGKSTLLRVVSGLGHADRGVVRFRGRTITYADAGTRVHMGIVQVPGGRAVFPSLTVRENLAAGAYTFIWDGRRVERRIAEVVELFPVLGDRMDQTAGTLSGGEQQMLGLAQSLLLDPAVLLIDELSLGLAPAVVQQLLAVVERLKEQGISMVIVEQSVNVALSIADRAVFMEKGQVRFEGPARELLDRDDLVRAVFLGEGGG
jgi:ABC-type branched-subunit amino acid transport system ATPase component/predicted MFS family arabinose efflux permease